jgi:gamma-glutamylcysteine synthetase
MYSSTERRTDPHQPALQHAVAAIAAEFAGRFPQQIQLPRTIGREAEFPVVDAQGQVADVRRLWNLLLQPGDLEPKFDSGNQNLIVALEGKDFSYALEVGVGTVEINTRPCADLFTIERIMADAVRRLVRAALNFGWRVLGYGIQPVTAPQVRIMSPKQRYQSLYRAMGQEWLWYTVTASDQIHVDVARDEMLEMLNYGNLITPIIIGLCANSPIYEEQLSPFCSGREGRMAQIHANEHRHGMPARPYTSLEDYVETVSQSTYLILKAQNEVLPSSQHFTEYMLEHGPDFDAFLFHEHYVWNSARLRVAYGTIEIRPACQQPWPEQMAAMALSLGLIEAYAPVWSYLQQALGSDCWEIMRGYHRQVIQRGLRAPQPAPDFLATVVRHVEAGLQARGLGEEILLAPIWRRLERQENPAQRARRVFQLDGLHGLLNHLTVRPVTEPAPRATRPAST